MRLTNRVLLQIVMCDYEWQSTSALALGGPVRLACHGGRSFILRHAKSLRYAEEEKEKKILKRQVSDLQAHRGIDWL
jgi:ATP:corrinoid adenosyltransferase